MLKVIVAGGRHFDDYPLLKKQLDYYLGSCESDAIEIVSGKATGADSLGERYAKARGIAIKPFPADWKQFGRRAGPLRNAEMAKYADACVVFWDGESRGTLSMINLAKRSQLKLRVVKYTEN